MLSCRHLLCKILPTHPNAVLGTIEVIPDAGNVSDLPAGRFFGSEIGASSTVPSSFVVAINVRDHPLLHAINTERAFRNLSYGCLGCVATLVGAHLFYAVTDALNAENETG